MKRKRILVALTSFKGTLAATQACRIAAGGLRRGAKNIVARLLPISDGGNGLLDAVALRRRVVWVDCRVVGPLGAPALGRYVICRWRGERVAFIESAEACGLGLVPAPKRDPMQATSYGVGQLIRHALGRRVKKIYVGLGGSASSDGGAGMAQALGAQMLDSTGAQIGYGAAWLGVLAKIDTGSLDQRLNRTQIFALCDVNNPLLGPLGTARVFAPQKGALPAQVRIIGRHLAHYQKIIRRDLGLSVARLPGAGAAGGLGAALAAFCRAPLLLGSKILFEFFNLKRELAHSDGVIVGEGRLDHQSFFGKAPYEMARLARELGKPVYGLFGAISGGQATAKRLGLKAYVTLDHLAGSTERAMQAAQPLLKKAAEQLARREFSGN